MIALGSHLCDRGTERKTAPTDTIEEPLVGTQVRSVTLGQDGRSRGKQGDQTNEHPWRLEDLVHDAAQEFLGNGHQLPPNPVTTASPHGLELWACSLRQVTGTALHRDERSANKGRTLRKGEWRPVCAAFFAMGKCAPSLAWTGATGAFPKSPASSSCFPQVTGVKVTTLDMRFMANGGKSEKPCFDHPFFWPGTREEFYRCRHAVLE